MFEFEVLNYVQISPKITKKGDTWGFSSCTLMKFIPSWDTGQWLKIHFKSCILLSFLFSTAVYSDLHRTGAPISSLLWTFGLLPLYSYLLSESFYFRMLIKKSVSQSTHCWLCQFFCLTPLIFLCLLHYSWSLAVLPWYAPFYPISLINKHTANSCLAYCICQI